MKLETFIVYEKITVHKYQETSDVNFSGLSIKVSETDQKLLNKNIVL